MGIQVIKAGGGGSAGLNLAGGVALSASLVSVVDAFANVSPLQLATASLGLNAPTFLTLPNWTVTLGIKDGLSSQQTVAVASAGTGVFRLIANKYTINNTAAQTGSVTGYFLNATETALNGITHNLMDLQVGGASRFNVDNGGILSVGGTSGADGKILFRRSSDGTSTALIATTGSVFYLRESQGAGGQLETYDGTVVMRWVGVGSSARLQLGGTTSSFPSIKRNGAAIDFRLADDSGFCDLTANTVTIKTKLQVNDNAGGIGGFLITTATQQVSLVSNAYGSGSAVNVNTYGVVIQRGQTNIAADASSVLQVVSTTQGFLPPRMTTAQVNAIVTPAEGLIVFNTTISHLCVYQAAVWVKLSHSPM